MTMRDWILAAGRRVKGDSFSIDQRIPSILLIHFVLRRVMALTRCLVRGVVISLNPRKLIFLGSGVELRNRRMIRFGHSVTIGRGAILDGLAEEGLELGNGVTIGPYAIVESTGVLSKLGRGCRFGDYSSVGAYSYVGAAGGVWIGCNVIMGQRVSFHAENHNYDKIDIPIREQGVNRQGITIEDDCWVGAGVIFLDGAYVEKGCVIGAGAVVRGRIPAYSIAVGMPARVIKFRCPT